MMNALLDKIILLLCCIPGLYFTNTAPAAVCAFWTALAISALSYALSGNIFCRMLRLLYIITVFAVPEFMIFLPLTAYDCAAENYEKWIAAALWAAALLFHYFSGSFETLFSPEFPGFILFYFVVIGCVLAVLMHKKTASYERLHQKFYKMRDDDAELALLLEERNQSLLEKQNNEIYTATLRERNRIAREIHDNVGHMITRSILMVGALKTVQKEPSLLEPLTALHTTLNQAMDSIRKSVHDLHDSSINLKDSLESLIRDFTFCPVTLQYDVQSALPSDIKYSLISIVKEALVNIARHSNATQASLTIIEHPGFYQFALHDNGTKIPELPCLAPEISKTSSELTSSGIGLSNIRARVKAFGGHLNINWKDGFRIYITIPKNQS